MTRTVRFTEIDLLRFLAALAVVMVHYGLRGFADGDQPSPLHFPLIGAMSRYNYLAVNLFFMISGFVILMTVQGRNLREFVTSRIVRLYPAYWFCCTLTFVVVVLFARDEIHTSLPRYLVNMTMLNGFVNIGYIDNPYWTLCVELKFYILIALLVATRQLPNVQCYLGIWLGIAAVHLVLPSPMVDYLLIPQYSPYFIAGCLFFLIHKEGFSAYRLSMLAASFIVAIAYDATQLVEKSYWHHMAFGFPVLICIIAAFYCIFFAISSKTSSTGRWDGIFVFLGTISYPLYLLHNHLGMTIFHLLHAIVNPYVLLAGTVVAMICLARAVHVFVERPGSRILRRALERLLYRSLAKLESVPAK